MVSLVKHLQ